MFIFEWIRNPLWCFIKYLIGRPNQPNYYQVLLLFLIVYLIGPPKLDQLNNTTYHPFVGLNPIEMIEKSGYPVEIHYVQTEDGFILGLHRIPYGKNNTDVANKTAVLLVHGVGGSSADYLGLGPNKSLAFLLADAGYDVWLENSRGVDFSKNHTLYDPEKDAAQYWDYSYDELGLYDHPAVIDYILNLKNHTQLDYIGHSQGCTSFIVMTSAKPEYNDKIKLAILMAPVVKWKSIKMNSNPLLKLGYFYDSISRILGYFRQYKLPFTEFVRKTYPKLCADPQLEDVCKYWLTGSSTNDTDLVEQSLLPVIYSNSPSEMSWKQIKHFAQRLLNPDDFSAYDYGEEGNMMKYGQKYPPNYNLTQVTAPLVLFYANNDTYITDDAKQELSKEFPNIVGTYSVPHENFFHLNFVWANNGKRLVYDEILKYLNQYETY